MFVDSKWNHNAHCNFQLNAIKMKFWGICVGGPYKYHETCFSCSTVDLSEYTIKIRIYFPFEDNEILTPFDCTAKFTLCMKWFLNTAINSQQSLWNLWSQERKIAMFIVQTLAHGEWYFWGKFLARAVSPGAIGMFYYLNLTHSILE